MKNLSHSFFFTFFVLHVANTLCLAALTEKDRQWLQDNLIKPQASPSFTITVNKTMLDPQAIIASKLVPVVDYSTMTDEEIRKQIEEHPLQAEAYIQLNQRYQKAQKYNEATELLSLGLHKFFSTLDKNSNNFQLVREVQKLYLSVHQDGKAKKVATVFLENNPNNVDALLYLAKSETLSANFDNARKYIDRAYALSPHVADVYLSEFLYQLNKGQVQLNKEGLSESVTWPISIDFFIQAAKENPSLSTPRTALHGLQVMQAFYSVILRNFGQLSSKKDFDFILDKQLETRLAESKEFFLQSQYDERIDPYFGNLCLLMAAIVENNQVESFRLYNKLIGFPAANNDLFRLMLIGDLSKAHYPEAIKHLTDSIMSHDNIQDRLMLAYLYQMVNNSSASLQTLMNYRGKLSLEILVHRLGYALLTKDHTIGVKLYQQYKNIQPLWKIPEFIYHAVIYETRLGNIEEATKIIQLLPQESDWSRSAVQVNQYLQRTQREGSLKHPDP